MSKNEDSLSAKLALCSPSGYKFGEFDMRNVFITKLGKRGRVRQ
jgi:hypothetical protein